ncbi:MAG: hypothetical protein ACM3II_09975 [Rhodospirillaceae bacterium]
MAGRQDAKTEESGQPLAATIAAAWIIQGLFLGSIAWLAWSEPMYWVFADDISLQSQVVLVVALPALLSGYWLVDHYARRLGGKRRLSLFVLIDIFAWASIAFYFGACLSQWAGSPPIHLDFLGELPLQLFVIYVAAAPTVFGVAWVILRHVRQLTDAVERLQRR